MVRPVSDECFPFENISKKLYTRSNVGEFTVFLADAREAAFERTVTVTAQKRYLHCRKEV